MTEEKYSKTYYQLNKEKILNKMKEKVRCETCDRNIIKTHIARHNLTNKHLLNIKVIIGHFHI